MPFSTTNTSTYGSEKPDIVNKNSRPSSIMSSETAVKEPEEDFQLSKRGRFVVLTLAVLTLMAALDGTSLSVALPV